MDETLAAPASEPETSDRDLERSLLADLLESSKLYHTTEDYQELLAFVSKLRYFAPFNAMLLHIQKPGLTYAASAYDWATRFGRSIKEDARPLLILWPFGPVALVYDVLDTEGDDLPKDVAETFHATGPMTKDLINEYMARLASKGIHAKHKWLDGVSDALCISPPRLRDSRPFATAAIRSRRRLPGTTGPRVRSPWPAAMEGIRSSGITCAFMDRRTVWVDLSRRLGLKRHLSKHEPSATAHVIHRYPARRSERDRCCIPA